MNSLLHVPFFGDELLTSYLSRMARANGRMEMRHFLADLGLNERGILRGEREHTDKLEELFGKARDTLRAHGFAPVDTRHVSTRGMVFPSNTITQFAGRFCPDCLEEDISDNSRMNGTRMYARLQWALRCVSACDRHERRLVGIDRLSADECLDPELLADTSYLARDFCSLVDRWRSMEDRWSLLAKRFPPTGFERFVAERLRGTAVHGGILDGMSLPTCIDACRLVGSASRFGRLFRLQLADTKNDRDVLDEGFALMRDGEQSVLALLDRLAENRLGSGRGHYGSLSTILTSRSEDYAPLKAIINGHAEQRIPAVMSQNQVDAGEWAFVGTVANSVALPPRTVARYLLERGDISFLGSRPGDILVPKVIAESAIAVLADVASFKELREILGCSVAEIRSIAASGLLKPIFGDIPHGAQTGTDLYLRSAVADLRLRVVRSGGTALPGLVSLRVAAQKTGLQAGEILDLAVGGRLSRVVCDAALPLFDGLKVDCKEIERVCEADTQQVSERVAGTIEESEISPNVVSHHRGRSGRGEANAVRPLPAARSGIRPELSRSSTVRLQA